MLQSDIATIQENVGATNSHFVENCSLIKFISAPTGSRLLFNFTKFLPMIKVLIHCITAENIVTFLT